MYLANFLYVSEFWQVNLMVSFAMLFVVYCSLSRNSLNLFRISGRLVTSYTNIGGSYAAFGSAVPLFASSFLEPVKTWYLLSRGMSWVVESLLVLCFFLFIPFTVCHGISWTMCMLSSSHSLVDVILEVWWLYECCGAGATEGRRMFRSCSSFGGK